MFRKVNTVLLTFSLKLLSLLPFFILWVLSQLIYLILYKVVHYRKAVIHTNLTAALPHLSNEQLKNTQRHYYRHLSQLIIEVLKGYFMTSSQLMRRITLTTASQNLIDDINKDHRNIVLMLGHYGNWEWPLLIIQKFTTLRPFALYAPLSSKAMDDFIKKRRERFGTTMLDATKARNLLTNLRQQPSILAIVGDQSPTGRTNVHETKFLSLETRFFTGGEKIAKKINAAVVYVHLEKIAFAQYVVHLELLTEDASLKENGQVTEKFARKLEAKILQQPEFWIWSHKRWKNILPY